MQSRPFIAVAAILAAGCGNPGAGNDGAVGGRPDARPSLPAPAEANGSGRALSAQPRWDLQSSGEGTALALLSADGAPAIRLFCPAGSSRLLVNVPGFRPIGSEERLSFGNGGEVVTLVADSRGDRRRGGVSGTGPAPDNLAALVGGQISVNYGAQNSGPHRAPPAELAQSFVTACGGPPAPAPSAAAAATPANPCLIQDYERLQVPALRAVGTEPFWGARIEGRCVTYSHPEDQAGTRVWTRYSASGNGGTWIGALLGRRFVLRTRAAPGCSDGMSDRRYPIAVELIVQGERRSGCAEPL